MASNLAATVEWWRLHQDRDPSARAMLLASGFATEDDIERPPPGWSWGSGYICTGGDLRQPDPLPVQSWTRAA
jgi:hypothetical protein